MKLLNSLLLCLMAHGIGSYKYYYKRIGNGFDIIYAQHEFGGYKELKSPKSLKVNHDNRGERPGVCNHGPFFCSVPYEQSATQHFECTLDYQCPRFFKCCQPPCFVHRVCQPAFGTEDASTLLPQPSTTTEPPEPEPRKINVEVTSISKAREEISTGVTSREPAGRVPTETDEISIPTHMKEKISTEISTKKISEPISPANTEIRRSSETSKTSTNKLPQTKITEDLETVSPLTESMKDMTTEMSESYSTDEHQRENGSTIQLEITTEFVNTSFAKVSAVEPTDITNTVNASSHDSEMSTERYIPITTQFPSTSSGIPTNIDINSSSVESDKLNTLEQISVVGTPVNKTSGIDLEKESNNTQNVSDSKKHGGDFNFDVDGSGDGSDNDEAFSTNAPLDSSVESDNLNTLEQISVVDTPVNKTSGINLEKEINNTQHVSDSNEGNKSRGTPPYPTDDEDLTSLSGGDFNFDVDGSGDGSDNDEAFSTNAPLDSSVESDNLNTLEQISVVGTPVNKTSGINLEKENNTQQVSDSNEENKSRGSSPYPTDDEDLTSLSGSGDGSGNYEELSTNVPLDLKPESTSEIKSSPETPGWVSTDQVSGPATEKIGQIKPEITTNIPSTMKSLKNVNMSSSSDTKKQTTAGIDTNESRERKPTSNSVNNTSSESRDNMTTVIGENNSTNEPQRQKGSTTQLTVTTELPNTSLTLGISSISNSSAVESTDISNISNTSSYDTEMYTERPLLITPTVTKINSSSVESNNLGSLDQVSIAGPLMNKTTDIAHEKEINTTSELVEIISKDALISTYETSDKPQVTETSLELKNKSNGYIQKENSFGIYNISGTDKKENKREKGQPSAVEYDKQRKSNASHTGKDDHFGVNNVENLTKFTVEESGGVNKPENGTQNVWDFKKDGPLSTEENKSRGISPYLTDDEDLTSGSGSGNFDDDDHGDGSGDSSGDGSGNYEEFSTNVPLDLKPESISEIKSSSETQGWVSTDHTSREQTNDIESGPATEKIGQITPEITTNIPSTMKSLKNINMSSSSDTKKQTTTGIDTSESRKRKPTSNSVNNTSSESRENMTTVIGENNSTNEPQRQKGSTTQLTVITELPNTSLTLGISSISNSSAVESTDIINISNTSSYDTEMYTERPLLITPTVTKINSSSVESNNLGSLDQVSIAGPLINKTTDIAHEKEINTTSELVEIISEDSLISTYETSDKPQVTETSLELKNKSNGYIQKENSSGIYDISGTDKKENKTEKGQPTVVEYDEQRKSNTSRTGKDDHFGVNNVENLTKFTVEESSGVNKSENGTQNVWDFKKESRGISPYLTDDEDLTSGSGSGNFDDDDHGDGSGDSSGDGSGNDVEFSANVPLDSESKYISEINSSSGMNGWEITEIISRKQTNDTESGTSTSSSVTKKQTTAGIDTNESRERKPTPKSVNNTSSESRKNMNTVISENNSTNKPQRQKGSTTLLTVTTELPNTSFGSGVPSVSKASVVESTDISNTSNTSSYDSEMSNERSISVTTQLPSKLVDIVSEDSTISTNETSDKLVTEISLELENKSTGCTPEEKSSELYYNIYGSDKKEHLTEKLQPTVVKYDEKKKSNTSHTGQDDRFDVNNVENLTTFSKKVQGGVNKSDKPSQNVSDSEKHRALYTEENKSRGTPQNPTDDEDLATGSGSGNINFDDDGSGDVAKIDGFPNYLPQ